MGVFMFVSTKPRCFACSFAHLRLTNRLHVPPGPGYPARRTFPPRAPLPDQRSRIGALAAFRMDNADPYQVLLRASHTIKLFPTPSLLSTMGPAMSFVISRVMSLWKTRPDRRGIVRPDWTITNDHHTYLAERVRVPGGQSHLLYPISQTSCRSPQGHVV